MSSLRQRVLSSGSFHATNWKREGIIRIVFETIFCLFSICYKYILKVFVMARKLLEIAGEERKSAGIHGG